MYCLNCGQQIPDGVEFCPKCGARTVTAGAPSAPAYRAASPAAGAKPRSKGPIIVIVVSLIVIAAAAGILAFVLMGGNHGAGSSSTTRDSAVAAESASSEGVSSASAVSDGVANGSQSASQSVATTSSNSEKAASASASASVQDEVKSSEQAEPTQPQVGTQPGVDAPFWGVWIGGFKNVDGAEEMVADAQSAGLPAMIFETTDWSNLNSEHYYVVSIGVSTDEATAKRLCEQAKEAGFDGAYVKYSGERR